MFDLKPQGRTRVENNGLLILRLTIGLVLLMAGLQKIFTLNQMDEYAEAITLLKLPANAVYAFIPFEIIAPIMLILGVFSRVVAGLIVIYLFISVFMLQFEFIFMLIPGKGHALESELLLLFTSLAICCLGSGDKAYYPD